MNVSTSLRELSEMFCVCGKFDYGTRSLNDGWEVNGRFVHIHLQSQGTCLPVILKPKTQQTSNRAEQWCSGSHYHLAAPGSILSLGLCLCFLLVLWSPLTSQKQASRWIGGFKLAEGVKNVCKRLASNSDCIPALFLV